MTAPHPVWLWIDPTRRCNLSCRHCYTRPSHAAEDLTPDRLNDFLKRIVQAAEIVPQELTLNWRGEPLMNRDYPTLLAMVRKSGLRCPVQFHTNAMLLTPALASAIVHAAGPLRIFLSIDGGSEASHDRNRGEGSFRRALRGAWNLMAARGARDNPRVILYQLDLQENRDHYDAEFLELASTVDDYQRVRPVMHDVAGHGAGLPATDNKLLSLLKPPRGPCFWAGNSLAIAPNGDVSICILSNRDDGVIGNMATHSLSSLLEHSRAWRRRLTTTGRAGVAHCARCRKRAGEARPRAATRLEPAASTA